MSEIGIGIIGFGFMGRTHLDAYLRASETDISCAVREVFSLEDPASASSGNVDTGASTAVDLVASEIRFSTGVESLLSSDDIDLVSICTPTDTHVDLAIQALEAGKHVLLEKPVALSCSEVERLQIAHEGSGLLCMPAMCMRFWPGWSWLREKVQDASLGAVTSASFQRFGASPTWSQDFYLDEQRSGGALTDLHVHDADFIVATFGMPAEVSTCGTRSQLVTQYRYPSGPASVMAEAAWYPDPGYPFQMKYRVGFEDSVADFDLARPEAPLILHRGGEAEPVSVPEINGYDLEVRHILEAVQREESSIQPDLEDAVRVTRLLEAEARSLDEGRSISVAP
ncbi:MAG: Gfo/Idh/MocA family oxidoreductase [Planctomycetota bacterium]|nr:Gfo/Idh/MocA family oxidoreductase [Planctomycetota bacterium]